MNKIIKKKKRRQATLIELLVSMTLMMIIMSSLAYFYHQVDSMNIDMEKQQETLFQELYLTTRLNDILPKAARPKNEKKNFFFYTVPGGDAALPGSTALVFTFDNGIKLDPHFSNHVLGRLFVDKENRLCLAVWPAVNRWEEFHNPPMKCEILQENVQALSFRFYVPPKADREKVWKQGNMKINLPEGFPETAEGIWLNEWQAGWEQLPALVEVILTHKSEQGEREIHLPFPLPNTNLIVVY